MALAGIAITNVLMPAFVKTHFPQRIPTFTAVYSTALTAMAFLSSIVVAPMSHSMSTGWRGAIGFWGLLALLAVIPAAILVALRRKNELPGGDDVEGAATEAESAKLWTLFRSKKARALALFFGIQSLHAFVEMGWLAQIFRDYGVSQNYAGMLAGLMQLLSIPGAMLAPALLRKVKNTHLLVAGTAAIAAPAYLLSLIHISEPTRPY